MPPNRPATLRLGRPPTPITPAPQDQDVAPAPLSTRTSVANSLKGR